MPQQPIVSNFASSQGLAWPTPDSQVAGHDGAEQQMPENTLETDQPHETKVKKVHASKACQQMKVRCELTSDNSPCRTCLKAERQCEPVQTPSRKHRSRPGSRVEQLEKKIEALTASLGERTSQGDSITARPWATPSKYRDGRRTQQVAEARLGGNIPQNPLAMLNRDFPVSGADELQIDVDTANRLSFDTVKKCVDISLWWCFLSRRKPKIFDPRHQYYSSPYLLPQQQSGALPTNIWC